MQEHDLLILGAGWTSTFLIPLLRARHLTFAATTRDGRSVAGADTIPWTFDPSSEEDLTTTTPTTPDDKNQFSSLPFAKHILITFPLTGHNQSKLLVQGYKNTYPGKTTRFIQLGSTGIWQIPQQPSHWVDRHSSYNRSNARAIAEDELLGLGGSCVLQLAGLWGGSRQPRNWVGRVAKTKEDVRGKKSLHMVHGKDVARAILAVMEVGGRCWGQRWMVTDGFVYDWWALIAGWADADEEEGDDVVDREPSQLAKWVSELMVEEDVQALPRSMETLGRCYDSREFWTTFGLVPLKARI